MNSALVMFLCLFVCLFGGVVAIYRGSWIWDIVESGGPPRFQCLISWDLYRKLIERSLKSRCRVLTLFMLGDHGI